jgi:hypothetical protein
MRLRLQVWQISTAVILLCVGALAFTYWRSQRHFDPATLVECLPPDQATHVYIAVDALRDSGVFNTLAGSKADEEPDYRKFVEQTGFDYRTDLDAIAAAFLHGDAYFALRGRFEWKRLTAYARAQGGDCRNAICSMPASDPGQHISFYPLSSEVLALAVTTEERGVNMIAPQQWKTPPILPPDPVWVSAPSFAFSEPKNLPAGAQAFLSPLAQGEHIVFAVGPDGQRFRIRLDVSCATPEAAAGVAKKLTETTDLLKKMLERDKMTPNARDLSGVLVAGTFQQQDKHVAGTWPVDRAFIEALASGKVE